MPSYNEEIKDIEKEIGKTKYNKATEHHIGLLKAKMARLKEKEEARGSKKGGAHGYEVRKTGDGTAILVGYPSVGKSTLLNCLTDANSRVGAYAFTTLTVIPGVLEYKHAKIQILDVPGIVKGAAIGTGRGKEVLSVIRNTDLVIYVIEIGHPEHYDILKKEVYDTNVRVNQKKPDVKIIKTGKDGIKISTTVNLTKLSPETIKSVMNEFRIINAEVLIREDISVDQLIDCIEDNKKYVPGLIAINKIDTVSPEKVREVMKKIGADIGISAEKKVNIEQLKDLIFERLNLIRIFMKEPRKEADMNIPLIVFKESTVEMICNKLHKDFAKKFKFCRIWGKSSKFPGQKLTLKHVLQDRDIIEIHLR
jgi:uncharacterized protein